MFHRTSQSEKVAVNICQQQPDQLIFVILDYTEEATNAYIGIEIGLRDSFIVLEFRGEPYLSRWPGIAWRSKFPFYR